VKYEPLREPNQQLLSSRFWRFVSNSATLSVQAGSLLGLKQLGRKPRERLLGTEDEFVRQLKIGNGDAYEELIRRFEMPLFRYFLASHGDEQLAIEQSADCFGDLVESLPKMTGGPEQLRAFVFAVARNVLRRSWRFEKRAPSLLESSDERTDAWPSPDVAAERMEESRRLIEAIRSLDEPTRDIFLLRFVELMPVAEIAAAVGEPIGTVKSRLSRGRERLAQLLHTKCHRHD
jgi:RNA polymerase sigma-70 factor, ECF subfamily